MKAKEKKEKSAKIIKSIDSKSSIKDEINKNMDSTKSSNKLDYANEFDNENKSKVKVVGGNKVSAEKPKKKVKVTGGSRVSKNKSNKSYSSKKSGSNNSNISNKSKKSNKSESAINKKESSKYKGVFYEEGLFMWSAEVDGKHLGLFPSEEEAHEKREEYIKNRSSN